MDIDHHLSSTILQHNLNATGTNVALLQLAQNFRAALDKFEMEAEIEMKEDTTSQALNPSELLKRKRQLKEKRLGIQGGVGKFREYIVDIIYERRTI